MGRYLITDTLLYGIWLCGITSYMSLGGILLFMSLILTCWSVTHHLSFWLLPVVLLTLVFYELSTDYISIDHMLASTSTLASVICTELVFFICLLGSMITTSLGHEQSSNWVSSYMSTRFTQYNPSQIQSILDYETISSTSNSYTSGLTNLYIESSLQHFTIPFIANIVLASCILLSTLGLSSIQTVQTILCVLGLGTMFLYRQYLEYTAELQFSINHSINYSLFYSTTALHGSHVVVGLVVLAVLLFAISAIYSPVVSRICVSYWYMVDLVWYFVLLVIYSTVWQ